MIQQNQMNQLFQSLISSNPLFQKAYQMAQGKSNDELQSIAANMCKERGVDMQSAFAAFKQQFPMLF